MYRKKLLFFPYSRRVSPLVSMKINILTPNHTASYFFTAPLPPRPAPRAVPLVVPVPRPVPLEGALVLESAAAFLESAAAFCIPPPLPVAEPRLTALRRPLVAGVLVVVLLPVPVLLLVTGAL